MAFNSILEGEGPEIDYINTFIVFLSTFASGIFLGFYGLNNSNTTLAGIGFLFSILSVSGVLIVQKMGGSFFKPKTSVSQGAFIFWATAILVNIGSLINLIGENLFSAFSPPGKAYAATALAGEPEAVQTLTEVFLAPQGENLALIGIGVLFVLFAKQQIGDNIYGLMAGLIPLGLMFAGIHTEQLAFQNLSFLLTAMALIISVGAVIYGANLRTDIPFEDSLLGTMAFFGGLHFGLNSANTEGLLGSFIGQPAGILSVPSSELAALAWAITALYGVSFFYAGKYVYLQLSG